MDILSALLVELLAIAVLFEARRLDVPYPALFVLGGLVLGFIPNVPRITIEPDLVLLVFLPPLLFGAAIETPLRELCRNLWPIGRLSIGPMVVTAERSQERVEHAEIQLRVINAQRAAVIGMRDGGEINDATLRAIERELDLEELRMES